MTKKNTQFVKKKLNLHNIKLHKLQIHLRLFTHKHTHTYTYLHKIMCSLFS